MSRIIVAIFIIFAVLGAIVLLFSERLIRFAFAPRESDIPTVEMAEENGAGDESARSVEIIAENLQVPWGIAVIPSGEFEGDLLVAERSGFLSRIGEDGARIPVEGVESAGEGGLLGLALHPNFSENRLLYLYQTTETAEGVLQNRVVRYRFEEDRLTNAETIIGGIPGARFHDGGRIAFGPDGKLYITTGDAGNSELAQDTSSLAGKILRINPDGSIPEDNPFGNAVWSYGFRNPQGIAWDEEGRLFATEHGPSGARSGFDEVNLVKRGANYGWPVVYGEETQPKFRAPLIASGGEDTWAPADIAIIDGMLFFTGLRGEALYRAEIREAADGSIDLVGLERLFFEEYGRLRSLFETSDNVLLITTSNNDGRSNPRPTDDRIIRVPFEIIAR